MRNFYLYIALVLLSLSLSYLTKKLIYSEGYYVFVLQDRFSQEVVEKMARSMSQLGWVDFLQAFGQPGIKALLVSLCIIAGLFLFKRELPFSEVFEICLVSEFVFLMPSLFRLIWFGVFHTSFLPAEIDLFPTFSLLDFFERGETERWLILLLQAASLFELVYICLLSILLSVRLEVSFKNSIVIVLSSYGVGLLLWISMIEYLSAMFN
jgi:hypothetical protein